MYGVSIPGRGYFKMMDIRLKAEVVEMVANSSNNYLKAQKI